ncbi:uncharacterized protein LOC110862479 [Folsomia candida]|uniref:Mite group 2 allergen Pso o 2 n=1 Tax=Folsomia candida TaxID=158441 RepID=A0A226CWM2_FOLCA|nr:uncharacterized protein LOC110862479 [Folsomia candida]OXA37363.1 Mite group 2 allergen Pso o 2 [Folsomia candida]
MKTFAIIAFCIVACSAGVVEHQPCGGAGQVREVRIENCQGPIAHMVVGTPYPSEADIIPADAAAELRLKISTVFMGQTVVIIDSTLPNSSVVPDSQYTIRWSITPSSLLVGNTAPVSAEVFNEATQALMLCGRVTVSVTAA